MCVGFRITRLKKKKIIPSAEHVSCIVFLYSDSINSSCASSNIIVLFKYMFHNSAHKE